MGALLLTLALLTGATVRSVCAAGPGPDESPDAGPRKADDHALHAIFQPEGLEDNSRFIHRTAASMPANERYQYLTNWVLPGNRHSTFRVTGEFGATNPAPIAKNSPDAMASFMPGVEVLSPAVDLVEVARQLDRLDALRQHILTVRVVANTPRQNYLRATLLFLVDVAREDFAAATLAFDEVIASATQLDGQLAAHRWPAVLTLRSAISSSDPGIRRHVTEFFFSIYPDLADYDPDTQRDVLNDHLRSMFALNQFLGDRGTIDSRTLSEQWLPFVYNNSRTRGYGRPSASWHSASGNVKKLAGHEMDYLSFRSPLRGNFEVECDFSSAHGEHFSFMIAGSNVQTVAGGAALRTGNFRKHFTDTDLDVPLTKFGSTARYRAVVRDGVLRHYLNGQNVLTKTLASEFNPWVTMRSWRRWLGKVTDFRITGEPVIPDEINLTGDPELSGWAPYFEEGFGAGSGNWQAIDADQDGAGIFGRHRPEYAGASLQKLLRYCRPIAEDGTIEYEFYYKAGESCVQPALDRLAFLLEPDGVKIHWITDRRYEHSPLDPANVVDEPGNRRGSQPLPLKNDAWNKLKLEVKGEQILLMLNGQFIYERSLEASNQRTFGLFHFADQTDARVRNVVWRGDWPKQLPPVRGQDFASSEFNFLDESAKKLQAEFHHDFRSDALSEHFDLVGDATSIEQTRNGLQTKQVGGEGVKELRSFLQIYGDFDMTVGFQDLDILMPVPRWSAGIGMRVVLDSSTDDTLGFYRTLERNADNRRANFFHVSRAPDGSLKYPGSFVAEQSRSGRLRLARRGSTFYALYAADDSPNFRLIGKYDATTAPVAVQGVRLILKGDKSVSVTAAWKNFHVRAENISGLPLTDQAAKPLIARLNARRDALPTRTIEFAKLKSGTTDVNVSGATDSIFISSDDGLRVTTIGENRQASCVLSNKTAFERGVDVEATMDIHRLGMTDTMESPCRIALKVFFKSLHQNSRCPVEATFILEQNAGGIRELVTRIVHRNGANQLVYLPLHTPQVKLPDSFRVVVHEGNLYFLYSEADSDGYLIAAVSPVIGELSATGFNLKFTAVGKDHSTDLTVKKLTVHEMVAPVSD